MLKSLFLVFVLYLIGGICDVPPKTPQSPTVLSVNHTSQSVALVGEGNTTASTSSSKSSVKKELSSSMPSDSPAVKQQSVIITEGGPLAVKQSHGNLTNLTLPLEIGSPSTVVKPSPSTSYRTGEGRGKINARKGAPDFNETSSEPTPPSAAKNSSLTSPKSTSPKPVSVSASSPPPSRTLASSSAPPSTTTTTTTTTLRTTRKKKKPLFTISRGDEPAESGESFIESPTTGRDYVFPIVLAILAVPALVYAGKFIYRRGTEFTERQQYHRMYLIDGMYNAR